MRLLKNKKGMDYSAFMVVVVLIVIIYLFTQLYVKLDVFERRIGDQELALVDVYNQGDKLLLFVDQAAKYSVYKAVDELAYNGAAKPNELPISSHNKAAYWYKDGKKLYRDIDFYKNFEYYLDKNMNDYMSKYLARTPFEFTITDDKILGIPLKPVLLNIFPKADKKEHYIEVMTKVGKDLNIDTPTGLGIYAVRPSFSVDAETKLDNYDILFDKIDELLTCRMSDTLPNCVGKIQSDDLHWQFLEPPGTKDVLFNVVFKNVKNPYAGSAYARFNLELK
jgi:hypothetical protein